MKTSELKRAKQRAWRQANPDRVRLLSEEAKARRAAQRMHLDTLEEMGAAMGLDEIAAELGVSRARVGQIIASALAKLRARHPRALEFLTGERVNP